MTDDARQRLNVRTIRVTLESAYRYASSDGVDRCIARARQLLEHARREATAASVILDIEALETELRDVDGAAHQRES